MDFRKVCDRMRMRPYLCRAVILCNRYLPYLIALLFMGGGIYLWIKEGLFTAFFFFLIPAIKFILASILRAVINAPRPYDVLSYEPLVAVEHGKGKSFPSRHTASAFAIARAFWVISPYAFTVLLLLAVLVGVCRVLCGCHYPKDVIFASIFLI